MNSYLHYKGHSETLATVQLMGGWMFKLVPGQGL